ncbi:facilitated trehalose transporter Tret1-like [Diorhabda sublineata]|uniref:facilitated trehalose transporter Tret1-like n=1 Tax=Diorhabda sublineata TaxID=1163346 RepID=UPI0024E14C74|nr:facilitated trehalose transporter Tret1-like [Diorhabda sublineata]
MDNSVSNRAQIHLQDVTLNGKTDLMEMKKRTSPFLYFAAITMDLTLITFGVVIIWISPVTEKLLSDDPEENPLGRPISTLELSLVGSLSQIGMVMGPVLLERVFGKFGRKRGLNIINISVAIVLVGLAFSTHILLYYLFILTVGILLGGTSVGLALYIGDITQDHNRAKMTCLMGSFIPIGNLYGFILGKYFSVKIFTLLSTIPLIISVVVSELFLPESPAYLMLKGDRNSALKGLHKLLRINSEQAEEQANKILSNHTVKSDKANFKILLSERATRKGFIISCILMTSTATTGLPSIMSYLEPIFEESGAQVSSSLYAQIVGIVQICCYFTAAVLVEKVGRRPLLLISAAANTVPLFTLGVYFNLVYSKSTITDQLKWLPVIAIITLTITSIVGICSVAPAYMNDVFSYNVKATAISIIYLISGISIALTIFLFPIFMDTIGLSWSFWLFCMLNVSGFIFIHYYVPETKGKDIVEIQEVLRK